MHHRQLSESQSEQQQTDGFDQLPDSLILLIFNSVSDIKTLIRCRAVSKRFNSLVPQAESLLLKVDRVISPESDDDDSFFITFLKSIVTTLHDFISLKPNPNRIRPAQNSPALILRQFERIRSLEIELPAGDLRLEKGAVIRWKAEFGKSLKSCVILGIRRISYLPGNDVYAGSSGGGGDGGGEVDFGAGGGLKMRVVWTISALIAASARHYMLKEVIRGHREMANLVVRDKEGEGTVVMDKEGLRECREEEARVSLGGGVSVDKMSRTTVPAVRMKMRQEPSWLELKGGLKVKGATLVVVRPMVNKDGSTVEPIEEAKEDGGLALGAFRGVYGEIVEALLKSRSYLLEMNSF